MQGEGVALQCPVCGALMERVTINREGKGQMQSIRCVECRTSAFLSKEGVERLENRLAEHVETASAKPQSDIIASGATASKPPPQEPDTDDPVKRWLQCKL
jgi:hypothetical protein